MKYFALFSPECSTASVSSTGPEAPVRYATHFTRPPTSDRPQATGTLLLSSTLYLRVFAAISVVWFHTPNAPGRWLAGPGVAVFLCLSFLSATRTASLNSAASRMTQRWLVTWIVWWTFYAAVTIWVDGFPAARIRSLGLAAPLVWPSIHLWYLPFLYFNTLIALALQWAMQSWRLTARYATMLALGIVLLLAKPHVTLPEGLSQWWMAQPTLGIGMAMGYALQMQNSRRTVAFVLSCLVFSLIGGWSLGTTSFLQGFACFGGGLAMLVCLTGLPRGRLITRLACLTLGVYLLHPFVRILIVHVVGSPDPFWLILPATVFVSATLTYFLREVPLVRRVI